MAGTLIERPGMAAGVGDEALDDARRFGLGAHAIADLRRSLSVAQALDFGGVFAVNAPIVAAFLSVASQWRTVLAATPSGIRTRFVGLDYAGARIALDALDIKVTPALWAGLAIMEQAAAAALNGD